MFRSWGRVKQDLPNLTRIDIARMADDDMQREREERFVHDFNANMERRGIHGIEVHAVFYP